jgi:putative RNA 2'-phosphotransferase
MNKENIKKSKFLSKILRHNPESAGITLDKHGWANVKDILHKCSLKMPELESIVETNDKKRFEFDQHKMRIRARQGHSIEVDVELKEVIPTEDLFHGTSDKSVDIIFVEGIKKQNRNHVHLSDNIVTASQVGQRHGAPKVFRVNAPKMVEDGFKFYLSNNGVYLTEYVPPVYLEIEYLTTQTN